MRDCGISLEGREHPLCPDCVEKLRNPKIASENWISVLSGRPLENRVCQGALPREDVLPSRPLTAGHRLFQHNRLGAALRLCGVVIATLTGPQRFTRWRHAALS